MSRLLQTLRTFLDKTLRLPQHDQSPPSARIAAHEQEQVVGSTENIVNLPTSGTSTITFVVAGLPGIGIDNLISRLIFGEHTRPFDPTDGGSSYSECRITYQGRPTDVGMYEASMDGIQRYSSYVKRFEHFMLVYRADNVESLKVVKALHQDLLLLKTWTGLLVAIKADGSVGQTQQDLAALDIPLVELSMADCSKDNLPLLLDMLSAVSMKGA